ncbi:MAG: hypothetical protein O7G88_12620, partial [bacterium]|nr:hypothetical protein [bacterium]
VQVLAHEGAVPQIYSVRSFVIPPQSRCLDCSIRNWRRKPLCLNLACSPTSVASLRRHASLFDHAMDGYPTFPRQVGRWDAVSRQT